MFEAERKLISFFEKHAYIIFLVIVTIFAILVRYHGKDMASGDYNVFLGNWYEEIKNNGGLNALSTQTGDYNVLYQFFIALFTYLPIEPLHAYKLLSCIFDFSLATGCGLLICNLKYEKFDWKIFTIIYSAVLFLPPVFRNSAFWAQCDSIYVSFIIWAFLMMRKERFTLAFILFGVSLSFKLQMIFVLPFIIYYYFSSRKFSLFQTLWIPVVLYISTLPALIKGRSWTTFYDIYANQTQTYTDMTLNVPNYWWIQGGFPAFLRIPAIFMALIILGTALLIIIKYRVNVTNKRMFLLLSSWSVWTCVTFLPSMHERYMYALDILLLLMVVLDAKKYLKFFVFTSIISIIVYGKFLFGTNFDFVIASWLFVAMYAYYSYTVFCECREHVWPPEKESVTAEQTETTEETVSEEVLEELPEPEPAVSENNA